jgi:hypothetical protein
MPVADGTGGAAVVVRGVAGRGAVVVRGRGAAVEGARGGEVVVVAGSIDVVVVAGGSVGRVVAGARTAACSSGDACPASATTAAKNSVAEATPTIRRHPRESTPSIGPPAARLNAPSSTTSHGGRACQVLKRQLVATKLSFRGIGRA